MKVTKLVTGDKYMFVHKGKLLQWARSFARYKCGKQMALNEEKAEGTVSNFAAVCKDCRTENKFCTSEGGRLKFVESEKYLRKW